MPVYCFRVLASDTTEEVKLKFTDDDAALDEARRTLRDLLLENGPKSSNSMEVIREDGTIVGLVVVEDKK